MEEIKDLIKREKEKREEFEEFYGERGFELGDIEKSKSSIEIILDSYIKMDNPTENVPLLVGSTATLKSSLVAELAENHGYRLIDLRSAFMSRLDIEGLMERIDVDGSVESYNAGMFDLIECTDSFIDFCREAREKILEELEDADDEKEIERLERMFQYYDEKSKPAILFFDEVTRADAPILNALTTILNKKEVLGYSVTYSKIISATNLPIGLSGDLKRIYGDMRIRDKALAERFEPIKIKPKDVEVIWDRWAKREDKNGKTNIHKDVIGFLDEHKNLKYNYEMILDDIDEDNYVELKDKLYTTPFPNYRTWEMVSDYIYRKGGEECLAKDFIEGLIGEKVLERFVEYFRNKGYKFYKAKKHKKMDDMVKESITTSIPLMLLGPSSIGKSVRVRDNAVKCGVKEDNIIKIVLSQQDSIDVLGPPTKVDMVSYVGGLGRGKNELGIVDNLKGLLDKYNLPEKVTIKAPKTDLAEKIRESKENDERLVLFFDEFNRVVDEKVMTSVFEAISSNRIFGVAFNPENVTVIVAGNIGKNYSGANDIDPAYSARFSILRRNEYNLSDVKAFKKYMNKNDYNIYIQEFINSMEDTKVLKYISSVDERELDESVPSMRAFTNLNIMLNNNDDVLRGSIIFSEDKEKNLYEDIVDVGVEELDSYKDKIEEVVNLVFKMKESCRLKDSGLRIQTFYSSLDGKHLIKMIEEMYEDIYKRGHDNIYNLSILRDAIISLYALEQEIVSIRRDIFQNKLGNKVGEQFNKFYNIYIGTEYLKMDISDLKDKEMMSDYFSRMLSGVTSIDEKEEAIFNIYKEFADEFINFKDLNAYKEENPSLDAVVEDYDLSQEHFQEFVYTSFEYLANMDARTELMRKVGQDGKSDMVLRIAEKDSKKFVREILKLTSGIEVSEEEIEEITSEMDDEGIDSQIL